MNWYKTAKLENKEDYIIWVCPITGIYITAPRIDGNIIEYSLHAGDGSFIDSFSSWNEANQIAQAIDRKAKIPKAGKLQAWDKS